MGATNVETAASAAPSRIALYHVFVHPLAERVLKHIQRDDLLHPGDRVGVAVSGGIDSVALFRLLLGLRSELGIVLSVVHFNHKLRGKESDDDQEFVADLARQYDLEFRVDSDDVAQHAAKQHVSIETAARELRYGFFRHLLVEGSDPQGLNLNSEFAPDGAAVSRALSKLDKLATAHTLDDQAETVLMRLIRGSGLRGLGGIHPRIPVESEDGEATGEIIRPLLPFRRRELETYLREIHQPWREDSSNAQTHFTRNRVRKLVVPLLEKEFNPAVAENLSELADIACAEEDYWDNEVAGWMGTAVHWSQPEWARAAAQPSLVQIAIPSKSTQLDTQSDLQERIENSPSLVLNASVDRVWFMSEPIAVQRRLIKAIGEEAGISLEFKHVEEILRFAAEAASAKELSLPLGWSLQLRSHELIFVTPDLRNPQPPKNYEYELAIPGKAIVSEIGSTIELHRLSPAEQANQNPDALLNASDLPSTLQLRNWRPGDRFWPAHTKSAKKVKELLQELHLPESTRKLWPVITSGNEIIWMKGFPVAKKFQAKPGHDAILIVESPLNDPGSH